METTTQQDTYPVVIFSKYYETILIVDYSEVVYDLPKITTTSRDAQIVRRSIAELLGVNESWLHMPILRHVQWEGKETYGFSIAMATNTPAPVDSQPDHSFLWSQLYQVTTLLMDAPLSQQLVDVSMPEIKLHFTNYPALSIIVAGASRHFQLPIVMKASYDMCDPISDLVTATERLLSDGYATFSYDDEGPTYDMILTCNRSILQDRNQTAAKVRLTIIANNSYPVLEFDDFVNLDVFITEVIASAKEALSNYRGEDESGIAAGVQALESKFAERFKPNK